MESAKIYPLNRNQIEGSAVVNAPATPLFPVKALSLVFRGKFLDLKTL